MLSKKMESALNAQVNAEMFSANLYLSMSLYCRNLDLEGCANWMRIQYEEEMSHAQKLIDFIDMRGGRVIIGAIEAPESEWNSVQDIFQATYEHEQKVTGLINDLVLLAMDERDAASSSFLQWYVDEQVEEESNVKTILSKMKMVTDSPSGLFMIDQELAKRVFVAPTA